MIASGLVGRVVGVAVDAQHRFCKSPVDAIELIAGLGVAGDAHCGATVQHRSRVAVDPTQPNLRQVHLIHRELFDEVGAKGFMLRAGDLGENVLTEGLDLLGLPRGARLAFPSGATVEVTGLRNPCGQIDAFMPGLLAAVLDRGPDGALIRKSGIMGVVVRGGRIAPGDAIHVTAPDGAFVALDRV